jgi:hypothetical protein
MLAARRRYLDRMAATLEQWAGQIAALQAAARRADGAQQPLLGRRIAALHERRAAYQARMIATRDTSAGMLRDMRKGAERIAAEFRRIHLQSVAQLARRESDAAPAAPAGRHDRPATIPVPSPPGGVASGQPHPDSAGFHPPIVTA